MREVGCATGEVNTAHAGGSASHEIVTAIADAYGFVWGDAEGFECFVDEIGIGLYRAVVAAEGDIKGAIESVDHAVHGSAVVVGDQAEFIVARPKRVDEFCCTNANGGVLCCFPLFLEKDIIGLLALFCRQTVDVLDDGFFGRAIDF